MILSRTYRILLFALSSGLIGPFNVRSQSVNTWSSDTTALRLIEVRMDRSHQRWDLDSVSYHANEIIRAADALLCDQSVTDDPVKRRIAYHWKALGCMAAGRSGARPGPMFWFDEAAGLYGITDDRALLADVEGARAEWYDRNSDYARALIHYRAAIEGQLVSGNVLRAAQWMNSLGVAHRKMGDYTASLASHLAALPMVREHGGPSELGRQYIVIGAVYRSKKEWERARLYFDRAKQEYVRIGDHYGMAVAYNDLGSAFQGQGLLDSARYWHERAGTLRRNSGDHNGSGDSFSYIAGIHLSCGELMEALYYFDEAYRAYELVGNHVAMSQVRSGMARVHVARNEHTLAITELRAALDLIGTEGYGQERARIHFDLGSAFLRMGDPQMALLEFERGNAIASMNKDFDGLTRCHWAAMEVHRMRGDVRSAFRSHQEYLIYKDSIAVRANAARFAELMMTHEVEQASLRQAAKDATVKARMDQDLSFRERANYGYMAGGTLFALLAVGLYGRLKTMARMKRELNLRRRSLKRAKRSAEQSERFKERFLANMSHEIRTPMNAIMGMSTILRRNEHLPEQRNYLDGIVQNSGSLLKILNDILDLSKLQAGRADLELMTMDLRIPVEEVVHANRLDAEAKGLRLYAEVDHSVPVNLLVDATRVKRMLNCLVENAIRFTDEGSVTIMVMLVDRSEDNVLLDVTVRDTGMGMSREHLDRLFDGAVRAYGDGPALRQGPGLGLAVAKHIALLHGGSLHATSEPGAGSAFTARLPFTLSTDRPAQLPGTLMALSDIRLLLAEDNAFNVMVAVDELQDAIPGIRIDVAANGREALEMFKVDRYDVILMDVQMPEMNGYEATRAIRGMENGARRTPIIAMSANATPEDGLPEADMDGRVPKPFKREELVNAIRMAINKRGVTS